MNFSRLVWQLLTLCIIGVLVGFSPRALAAVRALTDEDLPVYNAAQEESRISYVVSRGTEVRVSEKEVNGYHAIVYFENGERRRGYIRAEDFLDLRVLSTGSKQSGAEASTATIAGRRRLFDRRTVGIFGAFSYYLQPERVEPGATGEVRIGPFSGASAYYGVMADFPLEPRIQLRTLFSRRTTKMKTQLSQAGSEDITEVEREQTFMAIAVGGKFFLFPDPKGWIAADVEVAKGTGVSVRFKSPGNNIDVPIRSSELPLYYFVHGSVGWSHKIGPKSAQIYLLPEARVGAIINTSPFTYNGELLLSAAWVY